MAIEITDDNFDELMQDSNIAVLDFWAAWCGPCKVVGPVIDQLAENNKDVLVGKINVDANPELARKFGIRSIPTVIYFKDGKEVEKRIGSVPLQQYQTILNNIKGV